MPRAVPERGQSAVEGSVRFFPADSSTPVIAFAKSLIREYMTREENPISFGPEQLRFLALAVAQLQESHSCMLEGNSSSLRQRVVMLQGQGGSGKTECLNIVRTVSERFELNKQKFNLCRVLSVAASNSEINDVGTSFGSMKTIGWPSRGPGLPF